MIALIDVLRRNAHFLASGLMRTAEALTLYKREPNLQARIILSRSWVTSDLVSG